MNTALLSEITVNGRGIPATAIALEAQNHHAPKGKPGLAWRKAARALVIRDLLLHEAALRGIEAAPAKLSPGRFETGDEALIRGLLDAALDIAAPSEADVRAEWEKDPARFRSPPLWEVSHILCACEPGETPTAATAQLRAAAILATLRDAPRRFADVAAELSDCGSKANGGALGQLSPGDTVPEFEAVLRILTESDTTPTPVRTRFGWHIIRMDAVASGQVLPFEAVRPKLSDAMEKAAWAAAARNFVDALVDAADVVGADIRSI